ncbi:hypothetical protein PVAP13_5KG051601 [Panicum virgatum]|uniref:Uncharacterized protein n=1 Tax=Panicum virgatum TaxID=38727 RepID=A0A8T0S7M2_PANVG|nr:hypothetical protein PVAP13_5KG051601 [Panicum virgatum]
MALLRRRFLSLAGEEGVPCILSARRFWEVVGAAGDRGSRFPTVGVAAVGADCFLSSFLLAVWVVGGLLCVAFSADWSSGARGGVGRSHIGRC